MQIKSPYYRVSVKAKINFNGKTLLVREDGKSGIYRVAGLSITRL